MLTTPFESQEKMHAWLHCQGWILPLGVRLNLSRSQVGYTMPYDPCLTWIRWALRSTLRWPVESGGHREQNRESWNHFYSPDAIAACHSSSTCHFGVVTSTWALILGVVWLTAAWLTDDKCSGRQKQNQDNKILKDRSWLWADNRKFDLRPALGSVSTWTVLICCALKTTQVLSELYGFITRTY